MTHDASEGARLWVEFADPANELHRIRCDLTWLTSRYHCIFAAGCPGIEQDNAEDACCTLGAHFTDQADVDRVTTAVERLPARLWARREEGLVHGWLEEAEPDPDDEPESSLDLTTGEEVHLKTVSRDGVCILFNRADTDAPYGCSLHHLAMEEGLSHHELKPDVCWQVPLRRTYRTVDRPDNSSYLEITIDEYDRSAWGPGGHDFDWWCTSAPEAHTAPEPMYRSHAPELRELLGDLAYEELARLCDAHVSARQLPLFVHPATAAAQEQP